MLLCKYAEFLLMIRYHVRGYMTYMEKALLMQLLLLIFPLSISVKNMLQLVVNLVS